MDFAINRSDHIFILTGAGISAESGLKTFRDSGGLWEKHRIEDVATPEAFEADPEKVWRFYSERRCQLKSALANDAHIAISDFQKVHPNVHLITQNVDTLHESAGSRDVIHMHGRLDTSVCTGCKRKTIGLNQTDGVPKCSVCGGMMRPDIVWFGEIPHHLDIIEEFLSTCALFIGIGTSGSVYPAAMFVNIAKHYGAKTVFINLEEFPSSSIDLFIKGEAGRLVRKFLFEELKIK